MKTQLRKPARERASYTKEYRRRTKKGSVLVIDNGITCWLGSGWKLITGGQVFTFDIRK